MGGSSGHRELSDPAAWWKLRLYISGRTPRSQTALANLERICQDHLEGEYEIEVIDLRDKPELARADQILAVPTLVRKLPGPTTKIVGDLTDTDRVLSALQLTTRR